MFCLTFKRVHLVKENSVYVYTCVDVLVCVWKTTEPEHMFPKTVHLLILFSYQASLSMVKRLCDKELRQIA